MISIGYPEDYLFIDNVLNTKVKPEVTKAVQEILQDVKKNGNKAVIKYSEKFDNVSEIKVIGKGEMEKAFKKADLKFIKALKNCKKNISAYHKKQISKGYEIKKDGKIIGQKVRPLSRVGIYVPGGKAAYPSSVLMNAIPAVLAGVPEIIMLTPPKDGRVNPDILAAAYIAGVTEIILIGGAQGIAALAYGTETIKAVDKIVGPGNVYVTEAKNFVSDIIGADIKAGPSEILIVADEKSANAKFVAADMLSQAEHDELARSIVLTTSKKLAFQIRDEIEKQIENLDRSAIAKKSINDFGFIVICQNINQIIDLANKIAPEHLEILLANPLNYLDKFVNAGSVFLGEFSPEALGDYYAGPNHVLPTGGAARFSSPLSVDSFIKKYSYIYYSKEELKKAKDDIVVMAKKEGLDAHAKAIEIRL